MFKRLIILGLLISLILVGCGQTTDNKTIKIGTILELTGNMPAIGASSKNAAEMAVAQVNAQGGLLVNGKKIPIQLFMEDYAAKPGQAAAIAHQLIDQDNVVAIIGPNASLGAIPAAEIAESAKTILITPWSTDPQTTLAAKNGGFKQYVFRACYIDTFESKILARFAYQQLKYQTAAVLYDVASDVLSSQATIFKTAFENLGGKIVAFESYTSNDKDFSAQLTKIKLTNPNVLFIPAYYNTAPLIAQQAKRLGMHTPFLGSDTWSSPELISLADGALEGAYFTNHYSPESKTTITHDFVTQYQKRYGTVPDDIAALTFDAYQILFKAIQAAGTLDRQAIRDHLATLPPIEGVTGTLYFPPHSGDPDKSAVVMQVKGNKFVWVTNVTL